MNHDILLFWLRAKGALDETFGSGGVVIRNNQSDRYDYAGRIALNPDGKIVISDASNEGLNDNSFAYARDIKDDTGFYVAGKVHHDVKLNYLNYHHPPLL